MAHLEFYDHCLEYQKFNGFTWTKLKNSNQPLTTQNAVELVSKWIKDHRSKIEELQFQKSAAFNNLNPLPDEIKEKLLIEINDICTKFYEKKKIKLFKTILESKDEAIFPEFNSCVFNFSGKSLSLHAKQVLSLGPKFCIPNRTKVQVETDIGFETFFDRTDLNTATSEDAITIEKISSYGF